MADSTRPRLVRLGILTIIGLGVFGLLVYTFRSRLPSLRAGRTVYIHLPHASEIVSGTPVRYLGIHAGQVTSVEYAPPQEGGVVLGVRLRDDAAVRDDPDARPYVDTKPVTGEAYIEFPRGSAASPLLKDGTTIEGTYRPTIADAVTDVSNLARTARATFQELQGFATGLQEQTANLTRTASGAIAEVKGFATDIRGEFKGISASIRAASEGAAGLLEYRPIDEPGHPLPPGKRNLTTVIQRVDQIAQNIEALVGDKQMQQDLRAALSSVRTTGERLTTVAERLGEVLAATQQLVRGVSEGKSTLGLLLGDPRLFERMVQAVDQISRAAFGIEFLIRDLGSHPGDYIAYGRSRTSEEEREKRRDEALKPK